MVKFNRKYGPKCVELPLNVSSESCHNMYIISENVKPREFQVDQGQASTSRYTFGVPAEKKNFMKRLL